jgi:hypothetical protein
MTSRHLVPALLLVSCLEPRVSDDVDRSHLILPAGSPVPALDEDPILGPRIAAQDGVEGVVPLLSGFAAGLPVRYWDFGPAPALAVPLYVLMARGAGGELAPVGHPAIIGQIPGDPGYSPFWAIFAVEVTAAYAGELLVSVSALQEARGRGLVGRPEARGLVVNCPVVAGDVLLEVADGRPPVPPAGRFYYEGREGRYFELGATGVEGVEMPSADAYVLRREGGEPLSEPLRGVDMTGDGDLRDTNTIFAAWRGAAGYTPLARLVQVVVAAGTRSIDTSGDDRTADLRARDDLFTDAGVPVAGTVVAHQTTAALLNLPQAPEATP